MSGVYDVYMAYKDPADRRAASKRHYYANKQRYLERNRRYRVAIREFIKDKKETTPCSDCNRFFPYYVMDFDHLDDKVHEINYLAKTGMIGALKKEIEKCEIVCSNCHRIRTFTRMKYVHP